MPQPENRREVTDVRALRALADPVRFRILGHLMAAGPATASECADVAGATPSNCSYHLRELARYGLVERVPSEDGTDGRERPWRAAATGFSFGSALDTNPATVTARQALTHARANENSRITHAAIDAAASHPPEWREATTFNTYALRMTAAELDDLKAAVDALIRPYLGLTRADVPDDAEIVHAEFNAFRHSTT